MRERREEGIEEGKEGGEYEQWRGKRDTGGPQSIRKEDLRNKKNGLGL